MRKYRRKQHRMIEKMNREKKEEIYESKLRFFTNITHKFCTPLTLIYGPCEKILAYTHTDPYIRKYGQIIQQNADRLNGLILELLEFRKLETGNKTLSIQRLPVSDRLRSITEAFYELAENRKLNYTLNIEPDIQWNTDISCFSKIACNLLSNAFKYTPDNGNIAVEFKVENQYLTLRISNSGKGIAKENLNKIFDRYKILDSFELNYSTRQFYRKLGPITDKSPSDIIKEYRLTMAERLLLTKNLTIEEIMDKTGFANRGTFYKLFSQRFGMPPRQYKEQQRDSVIKQSTDGL